MSKQNDLDALRNLESANVNQQNEQNIVEDAVKPNPNIVTAEQTSNRPNMTDGWNVIDRDTMPQGGVLYPESWQFAYRCPTAKEVANFSTINEQDQPGIIVAVEDLIRKCVIIYDQESGKQISTGELCDAHRMFFLLLIRDFYLPGKKISYSGFCQTCHEQFTAELDAYKLIYPSINDKLLSAYDGRTFTLDMGLDKPIIFRVPTLETTGRIFKYITKIYRNTAQGGDEKKNDNIVFDKQFLLVAPFLYVTGKETVRDLTLKYKTIQRNDELFKAYLEIVNRLKLDNEEYFDEICPSCGSEEETQIKFPGGWKKLFMSTKDTTGYFD